MDDIIELDHRISVAIGRGRGIRLSDEELDVLVTIGAIEVVKLAASAALKDRAERRQQERAEYRALSLSNESKDRSHAANLALQRAQELLKPKRRIPRKALRTERPE